ncbi:hypothetical protein [Mycobacterium decipiens]
MGATAAAFALLIAQPTLAKSVAAAASACGIAMTNDLWRLTNAS